VYYSAGILVPVHDNQKQNWRILTNKEIYETVKKKPTIMETIRIIRLQRFGHVQTMQENRIPKRVLCMNLETRWRGRGVEQEIDGKMKWGRMEE
jgi:hypothetical protein